MIDVDIAVVGAGLCGCALAAALHRRGFDVRLYEASAFDKNSGGNAVFLAKNGHTALSNLLPDAAEKIRSTASTGREVIAVYRPGKDAEPQITTAPLMQAGQDYIRWTKLHDCLKECVPEEVLQYHHKATGVTEDPVQGGAVLHFKDKPDVSARLVLACDGIRSAVRPYIVPGHPGPRFLGYMSWYSTVPDPGNILPRGASLRWSNTQPGGDPKPGGVICQMFDAGQGYTTWVLIVNSEQPDFTDKEGRRPGSLTGRWGTPGVKERVLKIAQEAGCDMAARIIQETPESVIFERAAQDLPPMDEVAGGTFISRHSRVILMGDAAHGIFPGPGLGARLAFEDADTLVTVLEKHAKDLNGWKHTSTCTGVQTTTDTPPATTNTSPDFPAVSVVGKEYEHLRLSRGCRFKRYAVEMSGFKWLRDQVKPAGLKPEQAKDRMEEFDRWANAYPNNMLGDPDSTWWKPPTQAAEAAADIVNKVPV